MRIGDFLQIYGFTERRRYLIGLLRTELEQIIAQGWRFRAYVFGSVVTSRKPDPGDIDVLLCISKLCSEPRWQQVSTREHVWIKPIQLSPECHGGDTSPGDLRPCYDVDDMVRVFNESTERTGENIQISASDCVEVTL